MLAAVQAVATFLTGPFGLALVIVAVCGSFLASMPPWRIMPISAGFIALFVGSLAITAAWAVRTFVPMA